jgi:hypothetical protein
VTFLRAGFCGELVVDMAPAIGLRMLTELRAALDEAVTSTVLTSTVLTSARCSPLRWWWR